MAYCDHCKKNQATMRMVQVINGERTEYNLCEECAAQMGGNLFPDSQFSLPNLLGSILGSVLGGNQVQRSSAKVCPVCGLHFNEIGEQGKVGCAACYTAFADEMGFSLKKVQGNDQHVGKIPTRNGRPAQVKKQMESYKAQLQEAVKNEEYEKAAEFRDKIKELEKQL